MAKCRKGSEHGRGGCWDKVGAANSGCFVSRIRCEDTPASDAAALSWRRAEEP